MPHHSLRSWLRTLWQTASPPKSSSRWKAPAPLRVEALEGRLAPAVTLSISDPLPLPEGDSGTSNMVFVVTRSGELSPAVQVNYATQDGTGPNGAKAGTDYEA